MWALPVRGLLLCLVAGSLFFNLKGIGESLSPWSQATVSMLANLFYSEAGRERVTVLRFREQDLDSAGEADPTTGVRKRIPFPIPYTVHAEVLDALASREPAAVLVDFAFVDARSGDDIDLLRDRLCDLKRMRIPVYLASFNYAAPNHGLRPDLFTPRREEADAAPCFEVVPVAYTSERNGAVQTYELVQGRSAESPGVASAALRLYPHFDPAQLTAYTDNMDIVWGSLPPRERRSDTPCSTVRLAETALLLMKDGPGALTRDCPYSNTLSIFSLFNETGTGDENDDVTALVKGRIVLYGSSFKGTDDWLKSPVHGTIPGVYLHAMALDNLIAFNAGSAGTPGASPPNRYKRIGAHTFERNLSVELWVDIALIVTGVAWHLLVIAFRNASARESHGQQLRPAHLLWAGFFYLPYLALSTTILLGLAKVGKPGYGVLQFLLCIAAPLILYALLRFGAGKAEATVHSQHRHGIDAPSVAQQAAIVARDFLVESSWIVLLALSCGLAFVFLDLGPRNFWAFAAFIAFTHMIDRKMAELAIRTRNLKLGALLNRNPVLSAALLSLAALLAGIVAFLFLDLTPRADNTNLLMAGGFALLVIAGFIGVVRIAPWLYHEEIINLNHRNGKSHEPHLPAR